VGPAAGAEWGPHGNRIAFTHAGSIHVVDLNAGTTRRLTFGRYDGSPSWSKNGGSIAYTRFDGPSPGIWLVRLSDGQKTRVVAGRIAYAEWAPDGRWIAYTDYDVNGSSVILVRPNGQGMHAIVGFPEGGGGPLPGGASWSPDSGKLAIVTESNSAACEGCELLWTVHSDGSDLDQATSHIGGYGSPFWAPDGTSIAFCKFGYAGPNYEPFDQQQSLVFHAQRYVGPTCGTSWQARP
jgi:Tol biopolymer transport system component